MDIAETQGGAIKVKDEVGVKCQKLLQDFLEEFKEDGEIKYLAPAKELNAMERCTLEISFKDVEKYNQNLAAAIIEEYMRIHPYLCRAVSNYVKDHTDTAEQKDFYVGFVDVPTHHTIRQLNTSIVGTLVRMTGQVVRTHPVHPELVSGTFSCVDCQTAIAGVEQQFKFTQPTVCRNSACANRRRFNLEIDKSVFVDFQKVRIQETQAEMPKGCTPKSLEVILRGEIVEVVQVGDRYDFTGSLIVIPDVSVISLPGAEADVSNKRGRQDQGGEGVQGLKSLGVRELKYKMAFFACSVTPTSPRFGGCGELLLEEATPEMMERNMTQAEWGKIYEMSQDKNLGQNLMNSLFPSIYGCEQIKKGVMLMLFGGVRKTTTECTTLRGDINCCIVGDPSTAKSQLLKLVAQMIPRAVYTSGKASSAAGLTAAVVRDEETSEFVIEAGALMLADNSVCCIDEFDKMDPHDQVAIHEAMEQQTISLAKAGIRATLNARTSILAAANPIGGHYDRTKSLQQNVMMSAPIMSRFDLFFVLIDECNEVIDYAIAKKIVSLHNNVGDGTNRPYTIEEVLRYITFARKFKPMISEEARKDLVEYYKQLRQRDGNSGSKSTWRITVRQLESMIRLSEAIAKLECKEEVTSRHVVEAFDLLNKSIIRVEQPDIHLDNEDANNMEVDVPSIVDGGEDEASRTASEALAASKKRTLPFDEYKRLTTMIVTYMRSEEIEKSGVHKSSLISWYLEKVTHLCDSEIELCDKKWLFEKVLDRLIYHDNIIIPLVQWRQEQGSAESTVSVDEGRDEDDVLLVVHPNYFEMP